MDNYPADVDDILAYFDEHTDGYSDEDLEAIAKKISAIRTNRKDKAYNEAIDNIKKSIEHFYNIGGCIEYCGNEECEQYYATPYSFCEDLFFSRG